MTAPLAWATTGLAATVLLLVLAIVVKRWLADRRFRRDEKLRPSIEEQIAEYIALEDREPASLPRGRAGQRLMLAVALEALGELRGTERQRVTELLEQNGTVGELKWRLLSRRSPRRREAAEALTDVRSTQAVDGLLLGLRDRKATVRLACAAALAELGDEAPVPEVLKVTDEDSGEWPGAAAAILLSLGRRVPANLAAAIAPERRPELRRLAAAVIGELRLAQHSELLLEALDCEDDELVARAARGLGSIGEVEAVEPLLRLLDRPERPWFVHLAAVGALGRIGDPSVAAALEYELYSDNWYLGAKAASSLQALGAAGQAALDRALGSHDLEARGHAVVAMQR